MDVVSKTITVDNVAFYGCLTYNSILVLKMMLVALLTGTQRFRRGVPAAPEDTVAMKGKTINESDEDVDRVKRAHMNDLENIPIFFLASFAYILTDPNPTVAINLFRVYTVARFAHTFVYAIYVVRQPARSICFFIGFLITGYMAVAAICHFVTF